VDIVNDWLGLALGVMGVLAGVAAAMALVKQHLLGTPAA